MRPWNLSSIAAATDWLRGEGRHVDCAQIANAEWNLKETVVRPPAHGYVTKVTLRPGTRVGLFLSGVERLSPAES